MRDQQRDTDEKGEKGGHDNRTLRSAAEWTIFGIASLILLGVVVVLAAAALDERAARRERECQSKNDVT